MGSNHFETKYQKVPIKIGVSIAIAIGFVLLTLFILGGAAWGPWAQAPPNWFWALALALALTFLKKNLTPKSVTNF